MTRLQCNKCEKICGNTPFEGNLYHHFKTSFHYGSPHDFEKWEFHLCEDCLLEFTGSFKIKPSSEEYDFDDEIMQSEVCLWPKIADKLYKDDE